MIIISDKKCWFPNSHRSLVFTLKVKFVIKLVEDNLYLFVEYSRVFKCIVSNTYQLTANKFNFDFVQQIFLVDMWFHEYLDGRATVCGPGGDPSDPGAGPGCSREGAGCTVWTCTLGREGLTGGQMPGSDI